MSHSAISNTKCVDAKSPLVPFVHALLKRRKKSYFVLLNDSYTSRTKRNAIPWFQTSATTEKRIETTTHYQEAGPLLSLHTRISNRWIWSAGGEYTVTRNPKYMGKKMATISRYL